MEPETIEIKKYSNRRFYDRTHSRHVTLEQIRELIQAGHSVRVEDSAAGSDITARVLIQLILEMESNKVDLLPVPVLVQFIRSNDLRVRQFLDNLFRQSMEFWMSAMNPKPSKKPDKHTDSPFQNPWAAWMQWAGMSQAKQSEPEPSPVETPKAASARKTAKRPNNKAASPSSKELEALQRELQNLQDRLNQLQLPKP